ncbi:hypothetical protein RSAG8_01593, partial [Rhizoctonia solani AG-8 WAC10335]
MRICTRAGRKDCVEMMGKHSKYSLGFVHSRSRSFGMARKAVLRRGSAAPSSGGQSRKRGPYGKHT